MPTFHCECICIERGITKRRDRQEIGWYQKGNKVSKGRSKEGFGGVTLILALSMKKES